MKPRIYEMGAMGGRYYLYFTIEKIDEETGEITHIRELSRTKQEFLRDADISVMFERFFSGGSIDVNRLDPKYLDLTELPSFSESQILLADVASQFRVQPAAFRAEFDNDEQNFVDWILDPENRDEAIELGVLEGEPEKTADPDPAAEPAPETPEPSSGSPEPAETPQPPVGE